MDNFIPRYCLSLLLVTSIATSAGSNETNNEDPREPRVNGRIVKLYSGANPEPYICTGEGFQLDPSNCAAFYRCVKERSGKFTVFRFQCAPGTVYDPDLETCNHPHSTRRTECGGTLKPTPESHHSININEIDGAQSELPRPISTKLPIYVEMTTLKNPTTLSWILSTEHQNPTKASTKHSLSSTLSVIPTKSPEYTNNNNQWLYSTQQQWESQYTKLPPVSTQHSDSKQTEPCATDGFMGDSENCRKFYRCVGNQRGGYTKYEFSCSESTVWDDEIQGCNHPWAVKRSKCGRSISYDDKFASQTSETATTVESTTKDFNVINGQFTYKSNKTIQQQLQISHGPKVTQTQTQISNNPDIIQNQTQFNYGVRVKNNQTQISYGTAISQSQTQIDYGNKGMQTQLQIDHSKDSSQSQIQIVDFTTQSTTSGSANNNGKNECSESGFMGDTNDCKKFYRCVNNGKGYTKYEYSCGDGTVWDPEIEACNHAWAVKECSAKHSNVGSSTDTYNFTTAKSTEYHTEHSKTTSSYSTSHVSSNTNIDDADDMGYGNQNNQEITPTSTTIIKTTTTQLTTRKPTESIKTTITQLTTQKPSGSVIECSNSGFMGDANDCKVFYRCVDNGNNGFTKYEFKCGDGTVWDPEIEACNHAWAVKNCGGTSSSSTGKEETTTMKENTPSSENVHTTVTLVQISTQAPSQSGEYDTGYGLPNNEASKTTTSESATPPPKQDTSDDNVCQSSGFMGDQNDCKKFYRCVDNGNGGYIKYEFTCGQGTVWDSKIDACNYAWAVEKCGGNDISVSSSYESTSQSSFITSSANSSSIQTTQVSKVTDMPKTTVSTAISSTTTTSTSNICSNSGFMGDSNNCKKFYRCVDNGKGGYDRYEFQCGEGTVWDGNIEACNHAWAVKDCGGSGTSTANIQNAGTTQSSSSSSSEGQAQYSTEKTTTTTEAHKESGPVTNDQCKQEGFYGDKNDCKKFYRCVDNEKNGFTKYEFVCGEGTSWNQEIQGCDYTRFDNSCTSSTSGVITTQQPSQFNDDMDDLSTSANTTTTKTIQSESESTLTTEKPQSSKNTCNSEGFYANPSNCKKFYRCVANGNGGYTQYDFKCGDGTMWNQEIQACDHESSDNVCSSSSSIHTNTTEMQSESTTKSNLTTKVQETNNKQTTTQTSENVESQCKSEGFFAHPNDCKKFIRCVDNGNGGYTRYEFSCGDGTVWVQEIQACDHDNDVNSCTFHVGSTTQTSNIHSDSFSSIMTSSTENIMPSNDEYDTQTSNEPSHDESDDCISEGYFGNKQDCRKFYRCVDNGKGGYKKYDFVCGEGTAWDSDLQTCNYINEVKSCSGSTSQENGSHQTTTNKNKAESESTTSSTTKATTSSGSSTNSQNTCENEGYFGDTKDCKKFYRCVDNGKGGYTKYDFTCGEGTIWDQDITTCNHPQDVSNPSCSSTTGNSDTSSTTSSATSLQTTSSTTESNGQSTSNCSQESSKKPANNNVTCDKAGYYANPNDCKKFYRCVDWDGDGKRFSVFHFECGEGTIWDPALDTCNHEDSVYPPRDCSQTQSQNVGGDTATTEKNVTTTTQSSTSEQTTQESATTGEKTTTEQSNELTTIPQTTTQESTTSEQTTTQQPTTSEKTTTQKYTTTEETTAQQTTTSEKTTTEEYTTIEQTTTQQSTTLESTTTQEGTIQQSTTQESSTIQEATTQQTTSSEITTTQESTTSEQTTTLQPMTSEKTTTQEPTTSEQTTTEQPITSEETSTQQLTTSEQTTTQQSTTTEQTTTQQSTTSEQTTTQQSTTSEQTTTQQSNTSEQTTTEQTSTSEQTTTQQSTTNEQTTSQQSTTSEQTTTEQFTTEHSTTEQSSESTTQDASGTEQTTTQQSTTSSEQTTTQQTTDQTTTQASTTTDQSTTQESTTSLQTTTQQSTISEQTTTEQANESTTEKSSTTTELIIDETTTTTDSTTDGSATIDNTTDGTIIEETTDQSSTQTSSTESDSTEDPSSTTEESSFDKECPKTEDDQYLLVCPTSFKRHPKYCNMFYQCIEEDDTYEAKIAMFKCPNNTIYDESKIQCVTEDKADKKCNGQIANKRRFKRLGSNYKEMIVADKEKQACSGIGYFPFEKQSECAKGFLKCEKNKNGELRGYVYQCPDGYIYWSISKRCERIESVRDCKRSSNDWTGRWNIPVERKNVATS